MSSSTGTGVAQKQTLEEMVVAQGQLLAVVNTNVAALQTAVNALAPAGTPASNQPVLDAITALGADIDGKLTAQTAQLTEVINDIEA